MSSQLDTDNFYLYDKEKIITVINDDNYKYERPWL